MDKRTRVLNHELDLTFPDSFHPLSKEELAGLQNPAGAEGAAFSDPDDHILFSVGWKPIGTLSNLLLTTKDLAKNMDASFKRSFAPYSYQSGGLLEASIGGLPAKGVRYQYTAKEGVAMTGLSYVLKRKKVIYYLHYYTRAALEQKNQAILQEILKTARWA